MAPPATKLRITSQAEIPTERPSKASGPPSGKPHGRSAKHEGCAIGADADSNQSIISLVNSSLSLLCRMIPGVSQGVIALDIPGSDCATPTAVWPQGSQAGQGLIDALKAGRATQRPVVLRDAATTDQSAVTRVALRLQVQGRPCGAFAVQLESLTAAQQHTAVQLLRWGAAWMELLIRCERPAGSQGMQRAVVMLQRSLQQEHPAAVAAVATTDLARQLDCERVSLGLLHHGGVRTLAISNSAAFDRRTQLIRTIEAAMDEALEQQSCIVYPPRSGTEGLVTRSHAALAAGQPERGICSMPLRHQGRVFAVLCLERASGKPFDAAALELCEAIAELLGPLLGARRKALGPRWVRCVDSLAESAAGLLGPGQLRAKVVFATLAGIIALLTLASGEFRVAAPASLEGRVQRVVVAPYDGYIESADARAGDLVSAGDELARLQERDLKLERNKWASEREELAKKYRRALAKFDRGEARVLNAQVAQAEAQLELVSERLARTRLLAPFDGVIVNGDLSHSLGSPVERGQVLFEVAPLQGYRVVLQIDERDISHISAGQQGYLVLSAMPAESLALAVEKVTPITQDEQGLNTFRVEARLEQPSEDLRPGMEGIGKIVIERRSLLWIWTHRLVDWFQLSLWSWWP